MYIQDYKLKHIFAFIMQFFNGENVEIVAIDTRRIDNIYIDNGEQIQYIHVKLKYEPDKPAEWHVLEWNIADDEFVLTARSDPENDNIFG